MSVLRPKQPFVAVDKDGVKHRFSPETLVDDKHWSVKGRSELFEPVEDVADRAPLRATGPRRAAGSTETADAREKRPARKRAPRKKAVKKASAPKGTPDTTPPPEPPAPAAAPEGDSQDAGEQTPPAGDQD